MKLFLHIFLLISLTFGYGCAQKLTLINEYALPSVLNESSGLIVCDTFLISHNDSGNDNHLHFIDNTGKLIKSVAVACAKNHDWEDIAIDEERTIFIGDFGNNSNKRKQFIIYKISADDFSKCETIAFTLSDHYSQAPSRNNFNFDFEALITKGENLYLLSKNNAKPYLGYTKCYRLSKSGNEHIAQLVDSFCLGTSGYYTNSVTGADYNIQHQQLALMTYRHVYLFWDFENDQFFKGKFAIFDFGLLSQKEGICFNANNELVVSDEQRITPNGKLRYYNYLDYLNGKKEYKDNIIKFIAFNYQPKDNIMSLSAKLNQAIPLNIEFFVDDTFITRIDSIACDEHNKIKRKLNLAVKLPSSSKLVVRVYNKNRMIYCGEIQR